MNYSAQAASTTLQRSVIGAAVLWVACIVGLAILQTYYVYSPVPVWDMWDGYLEFYEKLAAGDWSVWWSQHNEHRLILGRLLFWADIRWFRGASIFLLVADYILLSLIAVLFWVILSQRLSGQKFRMARILLGLYLVAWLFLLCQGENLTWAFQGQFYFTFLLPLCAFYWLQKSGEGSVNLDFLAACAFGVLAAGAMANGISVLPLMTAYALLTRQRITRVGILAFLAVSVAGLYFHGYTAPGGHSLLAPEVLNHLFDAFLFVLTMLGNPFYFIVDRDHGQGIAEAFGVLFILGTAYKSFRIVPRPRADRLQTALVFFTLYVLASTVGVAGGRLFFGLKQALAPHYTTLAIMGWAALVALYSADLAALNIRWQRCLAVGAVLFAVLMTNSQIKALARYDNVYFERKVAILGLALGVSDQTSIQILTDPAAFRMIPPIAEKAVLHPISIFRAYPFRNARRQLGIEVPSSALPACAGALNEIETTTDPRFIRVSGWLVNPSDTRVPKVVRLLSEGKEVGFSLIGEARPDLLKTLGKASDRAGYRGYAYSSAASRNVVAQAEDRRGPICRMNAVIPALLFSSAQTAPGADKVTIDASNILSGNEWVGGDAFHTNACSLGLRIFGSFMRGGDADSGSISLRLKRGEKILYRSGPTGGQQILEIAGRPPVVLPLAVEWVVLDFSSPSLPEGEFVAKLSDRGTSWGEWSAIAVRDSRPCPQSR